MKTKRITTPFEIKGVTEEGSFSGYGSVFGVRDSYGDVVVKGAFAESLGEWGKKGKLPKMLWQHRASEPIGVWTKMVEDDHGLFVEGRILLSAGDLERRAYEHIKAGSVDGLSIGFMVRPGGEEFEKATNTNLLKGLDLWEVSPVTFPANPEAEIGAVKTAIDGGPAEFERFLREAGLSRSQAKGLMARGYVALRDLREAGDESLKQAVSTALETIRAMRGQE